MTAVAAAMEGRVRPRPQPWGAAFGVELSGPLPVEGIAPAAEPGRAPGAATFELVPPDELKARVATAARASLLDRRHRDGRMMLSVDRHDGLGYSIRAPQHGRHLVSLDGTAIASFLPRVPSWQWQRLLFAQTLPLAATLQGIELLHASGVVLGGRAFGFVARSGTGKTTLAANLAAEGAELLTDDVLAIETDGDEVSAHPGARLASLNRGEYGALDPLARARLGEVVGEEEKVHLAARLAAGPAPLGAIYFLERDPWTERFAIETAGEGGAQLLLAGRFITYLDDPHHLLRHLDATARITAAVPLLRVSIPIGTGPREVAQRVREHAVALAER